MSKMSDTMDEKSGHYEMMESLNELILNWYLALFLISVGIALAVWMIASEPIPSNVISIIFGSTTGNSTIHL